MIRLNPHPHTLVLDGVYVRDADGTLYFHELPPPTPADVAEVAARTAIGVERVLEKHGRVLEEQTVQGRVLLRSWGTSTFTIPSLVLMLRNSFVS